jgi:hypothetical protein
VSEFLCVVLSCVGTGLASGRSPVQGVLPIVYRFTGKNPSTPQGKKRTIKKERKKYKCIMSNFIIYRTYSSPDVIVVCIYVQLSPRRLVGSSYSAGTRCARAHTHTHTHTHTCTRIYLHMHTQAHTHKYTYSAPHIPPRGVLSQELNGVGWPVPFPFRTAHNQVTMKCITWLK